ncbi:hypothetical protein AB0M47_10780 [Hamadaea sp. NPDC051192]|uniref:hypothetical protein n=1 Tax=Hamadaea sp. NPDC051192 TaxID=3154940 RepID=UPI003422C9A1
MNEDLGAHASIEAIEAHYQKRWGDTDRDVRQSEDIEVVVHRWPLNTVRKGILVYATAGIDRSKHEAHLNEFLVVLSEYRNETSTSLADLWVAASGARLRHGTTVNVGRPLWKGAAMASYLITRQSAMIEALRLAEEFMWSSIVQFQCLNRKYDSR